MIRRIRSKAIFRRVWVHKRDAQLAVDFTGTNQRNGQIILLCQLFDISPV